MQTYIYDIDGTLTLEFGDKKFEERFDTYAFWPLINYHLARSPDDLHQKIKNWGHSYKGTGTEFIESTHNIVQICTLDLHEHVTGTSIANTAKNLTFEFISENIIRRKAIEHIKHKIETDSTCILSTGSYQEGAYGFVLALIDKFLLPANTLDKIIISGSVVDWNNRVVSHTNVGLNKVLGLRQQCAKKNITLAYDDIQGIYIDDPVGNDSGLYAIKPDATFLVETNKNKDIINGFNKVNW